MYSGLDPDLSQSLTLQALRRVLRQVQAWARVKAPEMAQVAWALALAGVWAAVQVRAVAQALVGVVAQALVGVVAGPVPPCVYPSPRAPQRALAFAAAQAGPAAPRHGRPVPRR